MLNNPYYYLYNIILILVIILMIFERFWDLKFKVIFNLLHFMKNY